MSVLSTQELYSILKNLAVIPEKKLDEAVRVAQARNTDLSAVLIEHDLISDENLAKLTADTINVPLVMLSKGKIDQQILKILPSTFAEEKKLIAFAITGTELKVASSQRPNPELLQMIAQKAGLTVLPYYTSDREIKTALSLYKEDFQTKIADLFSPGSEKIADLPITEIVNAIIEYAYAQRASDIHIEPERERSLIRFRIDGVLTDILSLPEAVHNQIITRIKVAGSLRTDEHMSAQDGKLRLMLPEEELDVRISIVPITHGEKCVMRLLTSHFRQFGLADLGMTEKDLSKVRRAYTKPIGIILSTGPTGSGKTTSIYSIIKILNTRERNIATIEDPVEYDIEGINQIQVNPKTNLTFAQGLRSILRQDPDIVYVGEIRDEETAGIAINSAMTGHLVVSTLHTNDAATSLPRLLDMNIEPFLVSSTVNVIIAQRLVRKICENCRVSVETSLKELHGLFSPEHVKTYFGTQATALLYRGKGCPICHHTGYHGRIGIFEILENSDEIKKLIQQKADAKQISLAAQQEGMTTMVEDGLLKVSQGLTTVDEILRVTVE